MAVFSDPVVSAPREPRDVVSKCPTEIKRGIIKGQFANGGPELQLIAVAVAFVAVVSPGAHVDREDSAPRRCRSMDRAWAMHLVSTAPDRLKVQELQYLLHRDVGAQPVEVDPWHSPPLVETRSKEERRRTVPFPLLYRERGTVRSA
jgi:hypothetical protein